MSQAALSLVSEHMTPSVVSVTDDAPLEDVLKTLSRYSVSCVLVTTSACSPVGVVALTDLARVSALEGGPHGPLKMMPPNLRARDIMKTPILCIDADATVRDAAAKMHGSSVARLFVLRDERIIGVFSTRDAMRVVLAHHLATPLSEVMATPVETISIGDSMDDAIAKLRDKNVRGLVVVDGTRPIGAFTQMEAIRARALPPELRRNPVEEVMSYETLTLEASTPLYRAAGHAIATRVRRILVVDETRALVGIVTGFDLVRVLK